MINRSHVIKMKPTKAQEAGLTNAVGIVRYVYNWGIDTWEHLYKSSQSRSYNILSRMWTVVKPEWSSGVSDSAHRRALRDVESAFNRHIKGSSGKPGYRKRRIHDSFYIGGDRTKIIGKKIRIPKIGVIRLTEELRFKNAKIESYTIKRKADGWYLIVKCLIPDSRSWSDIGPVGVDVGCTPWATSSDNEILLEPDNVKYLRRRLAKAQHDMSRKSRGSSNRAKAVDRVGRLYQRIDNIKKDATHKYTHAIAKNHRIVCVEGIDVSSLRSSKLPGVRKGVHNGMLGEIIRQLKYKSHTIVEVDRFYPSTQLCSSCGSRNTHMRLQDRVYNCTSCGISTDRDLNAAINILNEGLICITVGHTGSACGDSK